MLENEYEKVVGEIVKHGVAVTVNKVVDDNYITNERKYVGCVVKLDFTEHDKVFEDKIADLKKLVDEYREANNETFDENQMLKKRIAELEAELDGKETECCKKPTNDNSKPSTEWYDNRHQSDCIEINRLNTTIDVLIHKIEYLRQFAGLE